MTIPSPPLFLIWIKTHRCLVRINDPMYHLVEHKKGNKTKIMPQQYKQLNTGAKEIKQVIFMFYQFLPQLSPVLLNFGCLPRVTFIRRCFCDEKVCARVSSSSSLQDTVDQRMFVFNVPPTAMARWWRVSSDRLVKPGVESVTPVYKASGFSTAPQRLLRGDKELQQVMVVKKRNMLAFIKSFFSNHHTKG